MIDLKCTAQRTESANAARFSNQYSNKLRYVPEWKSWLYWDGKRWARDVDSTVVSRLAQEYAANLWKVAPDFSTISDSNEVKAIHRFITATNSAGGIASIITLSRAVESLSVRPDQLDANPLLLNLRNGTLDLSTGELRDSDPSDLLTQVAAADYDPSATCREWTDCISTIFAGDNELIGYVQSLLGYSLSGLNDQHLLPICYGSGCNGKSTVWNVVSALLGDYALLADDSLLLGDSDSHPTAKVALFGKRFVALSEPELGAKLRESRVKELTGDSYVTARGMRQDFWTFKRTHKFWLATNHLPRIDGTDNGIWRRIKLIPFGVDLAKLGELDTGLQDRLLEKERSGILNWLVEGWTNYRNNGLNEPKSVIEKTARYRTDSDPLEKFVLECCETGSDFSEPIKQLYAAYLAKNGTLGERDFNRAIKTKFDSIRAKSGPYRDLSVCVGVRIKK